jgi:DNA polymerase-3 subunit alpha
MNGLEKLQLLKMDFLGLTTLTLIDDALKLIEKRHGVRLVPEDLPLDDPATYEIFSKALTSGIFQFESPGMRDILRRYHPTRIEDLTALNALYRPGPIQGGMVDDFIDRKQGRKAVAYDLPELKALLEETYGVIVYQEQVMQISNVLAGYSLGEADILRRAMGKKKAEEMAAQRQRFIKGALERGFPQKKIEKIFDLMEQFAGYGFNKSHSAAYAYLAFVTAYLKAHYPVDFMAALLTSETGNTAKVVKYINECREMGITVLQPDVNASDWNFTPDDTAPNGKGIRFGLGAVKNLGPNAVEAIRAAREKLGRFLSIYEFCEHVDLSSINRRMIESLIRAGAMDSLEGTRAQLFAATEGAMEAGQRVWRDRVSGQGGLFGDMTPEEGPVEKPLPQVPDWTGREKLQGEKEMLGFYVTGHPLDDYGDKIRELATHDTGNLEGLEKGTEVACAACSRASSASATASRSPGPRCRSKTAPARSTAWCSPPASSGWRARSWKTRRCWCAAGAARRKRPAQDFGAGDSAAGNRALNLPSLISIRVWLGRNGVPDKPAALRELFRAKPGESQVRLRLEMPRDFSVILDVPAKVRPDREFKAALEKICGPDCVEVLAGYLARDVELHFAAGARQVAQMRREHDPDHGSVWTSTESTAGRSRTIGSQWSPASAEA